MNTLYNIKDNPKASQFWIHLSLILWYSTSVHLSKKGFFPCQVILIMKDGLFCLGSQQLHHKYFHFWGPCTFPFASQYEEPHSFTRCFPPAMRDKPSFLPSLPAPSAQLEKQTDPVRRRWRPLSVLPDSCYIAIPLLQRPTSNPNSVSMHTFNRRL